MKKYVAFLLATLMCANLCACGAEQAEPEVEKTPVVEKMQEVVVPAEPVVQEVSTPKEKLSLMTQGYKIENGGLLYINEVSESITVYQNRKKLNNCTVKIQDPDILEYAIGDNGNIILKALDEGETEVVVSYENSVHCFTVETKKKIYLRDGEEIIEPSSNIPFEAGITMNAEVLLNDDVIKDYITPETPYLNDGRTNVAFQEKQEDGTLLLHAMNRGNVEIKISSNGLVGTFILSVEPSIHEASRPPQTPPQSSPAETLQTPTQTQSTVQVMQQINYDYDPANAISYGSLQSAVDAQCKAEAKGSFAGFDKYLVEDPSTNGLVSSAEIKALKSGSGNMPNSVTYEQAVEDVDLLFRTMKVGYGAYYFFGEEKWEQAETEVMDWLNGQANVSTKELRDKLRTSTAFMRDAHSWIAKKSDTMPGFRYEYYYCTGHGFSKDENGFYKEKDGVKWYYESCDNGAVSIEPSLKKNGSIVYQPVLFSPWYAASSQITLSNGSEKKNETVVWNLSQEYSYSGTRADYKYIEESGIAYMSIRDFHDNRSGEAIKQFAQSGSYAKDAKVFIIDIRANGGGNGEEIDQWFKDFTGQTLNQCMIKSVRESVVNDKSNGRSQYQNPPYKSAGKIAKNNIPVILLVDDKCGSAGETMLDAVKNMTNVLVVGSNSAGYQLGGNSVDIHLPHSQIAAEIGTQLRFYDALKNVDGIGYEPDVWCNPQTALSASLNLIKQYGLADEAAVSAMAKQLGVNL